MNDRRVFSCIKLTYVTKFVALPRGRGDRDHGRLPLLSRVRTPPPRSASATCACLAAPRPAVPARPTHRRPSSSWRSQGAKSPEQGTTSRLQRQQFPVTKKADEGVDKEQCEWKNALFLLRLAVESFLVEMTDEKIETRGFPRERTGQSWWLDCSAIDKTWQLNHGIFARLEVLKIRPVSTML